MRIRVLGVLVIVLAACNGADSSSTTAPADPSTAAPSTTLEPTTSTTVETTTTLAPDAVPPELLGQWTTTLDSGFEVNLTLGKTFFTIHRRDLDVRSSGKASVEGDTIEFSLGEFCSGVGSYTWALEGEALTFTLQGVDECGRSQVLDGLTYTLVAPPP